MLHDLIASSTSGETILDWIEFAALAIEIIAVAIIAGAIVYSIIRFFVQSIIQPDKGAQYKQLKVSLGKSLLLGLEILVAADIVRTVALEATFESVIVLGLLVLIRTFLSWALVVEIEGRWPWQPRREGEESM
jgi:uncharacterized membrane protein